MRLLELADLLDLVHEVTSVDVLHDKIEPVLVSDNTRVQGENIREFLHLN